MFELFKTCWEPVRDDVDYEVILCHSETAGREGRRLTIATGGPGGSDAAWEVAAGLLLPPARIEAAGIGIDLLRPWLPVGAHGEAAAWRGPRRLRLGYDLFGEIEALLTTGQVGAAARNANAGRHLEVLRSAMLDAGLPVVEVEAVPAGTSLTVAVTRCGLRPHAQSLLRPDRRRLLLSGDGGDGDRCHRGRASLHKLGRNLATALKLPFVYLGWAREGSLERFAKYAALERNGARRFTSFLAAIIPADAHRTVTLIPAACVGTRHPKWPLDLTALAKAGFEVGLHGLDAWIGLADATAERSDIQEGRWR
jgi:hypothetical protein